jgi:L-alanine-DL-glutamate epimerase-like enolase superfamily enzyme
MKTIHLCESFGIRIELHGSNAGNLQVLGAMGIPGEMYERGLLHPMCDYENKRPWLKESFDPMDSYGNVHISQKPGLGMELDWKFIEDHMVDNS